MKEKITLKNVKKTYGKDNTVIEDMNFHVEEGSFTVLLGPSGCGKSTLLRMIAGLEEVTDGEILIDGVSMDGVEPGKRNVAMVFQNYALYPNMTVRQNIEFGLKNVKVPKLEREERIEQVTDSLGIADFLDRKPQNLSGGQRQRVALARALVKNPSVFLMDEPLSNLDAKLRSQIRMDLIELHRKLKTTFIYVTHDQVEAMSMGTEIVLLEKGKIKQSGSPREIYDSPDNIFSARFIGSPAMNILTTNPLTTKADLNHIGFRPETAKIVGSDYTPNEFNFSIKGEIVAQEILGDQKIIKLKSEFGDIQVKNFDIEEIPYGNCTVVVPRNDLHFFNESGDRMYLSN